MRLYLDCANSDQIQTALEFFPISGVTTNPTLISKEKKPLHKVLDAIVEQCGTSREIFVQVVGNTYEEMLEDVASIHQQYSSRIIIKVPVNAEGIKCMMTLKKKQIPVLATCVYTVNQALLALACQVDYIAPYVNRIENAGGDAVDLIRSVRAIIDAEKLGTQIVAASFKNAKQVSDVLRAGSHCATIPFDILKLMIKNDSTDKSIETFNQDWLAVYAEPRLKCVQTNLKKTVVGD